MKNGRKMSHLVVNANDNIWYCIQIRKSVRKKHTLPAYKIRYQPFFTTPSSSHGQVVTAPRDIYVSGQRLNMGQLCVNVLNCTRLIQLSADDAQVYCTVSIGNCCSHICVNIFCLLFTKSFNFVIQTTEAINRLRDPWLPILSKKSTEKCCWLCP